MFGLDNNVLLGLVGVVVAFCLLTNKKSFKSLMKKDMLMIVGLTLLLACCMAKGGRVVEGNDGDNPNDYQFKNPDNFTMMEVFSQLEDSTLNNIDRICHTTRKFCTDGHLKILEDGGSHPVIKTDNITAENVGRLKRMLAYLKNSGMGGTEHMLHNLNSHAGRLKVENVVDVFDGDREAARDAFLNVISTIQSGGGGGGVEGEGR